MTDALLPRGQARPEHPPSWLSPAELDRVTDYKIRYALECGPGQFSAMQAKRLMFLRFRIETGRLVKR